MKMIRGTKFCNDVVTLSFPDFVRICLYMVFYEFINHVITFFSPQHTFVYFDVTVDGEKIGRLLFEVRTSGHFFTGENSFFLAICIFNEFKGGVYSEI